MTGAPAADREVSHSRQTRKDKEETGMDDRCVPVLWDEECFSASIYNEMVRGITNAAALCQGTVEIYTRIEKILEKVPKNRTVIVIGYESPRLQTFLTTLTEQGRQVLLAGLDGDRFGAQISSASPSRRRATALLIQYLLACGKERIALVACGDRSVNDMMRCETLRSYLLLQNCQDPDRHIFYYRDRVEESFEAFVPHWREFDAVICPNDYVALCLIRFCQDRGIRIPEDLFLAAFSDRALSQFCKPSITTMSIDFAAVGDCAYQAWKFLEEHREDNLNIQITTPSRLVIRQSTNNEMHAISSGNVIIFNSDYEGGPFYTDPTIAKVMQIENCLAQCDSLNLQIIGNLLEGRNYEYISEKLFLSRSALNYRVRKIFSSASVKSRKEFELLFEEFFTREFNI